MCDSLVLTTILSLSQFADEETEADREQSNLYKERKGQTLNSRSLAQSYHSLLLFWQVLAFMQTLMDQECFWGYPYLKRTVVSTGDPRPIPKAEEL